MSSTDNADASQAQLQLLLAELKRIEGQQQQLKKAAAENQVLIVHPVEGFKADDVDEYAEPEEVKPDPDRFVPSGGMTGFDVAKDLLKIDFSPPKEAPEEFRALSFIAPPMKQGYVRPALLASQIYHQGSFGAMDPASNDLYMFLEKLQQQQKEVVALIKERQRIIAAKNGDAPSPMTADAAAMGVSPSPKSVTAADAIPAKPSRFATMSEGDAALRKAKEAGMQELNPGLRAQAEVLAMRVQAGGGVQGTAAAMEPVTTTGNNVVTESRATAVTGGGTGGSGYQFNNTPSTAVPGGAPVKKDDEEWRQPIPIDMTFGVGLKTRSRRHRPAQISFWGCAIFALYIATFLFYAYCRIGHTLDRRNSAFAYQVIFLILELGTFVSGMLFGLCQLCVLRADKPERISEMAHRLRGTPDAKTEADTTNMSAAVDQNGKPLPDVVDPDTDKKSGKDSDKDAGKKVELSADSKRDKYGYKPKGILQNKYHVQVLVWSGPESTADSARCKAALLAAHNMRLPVGPHGQRCTRIVYLVDPDRNSAKMELVRELALDSILYMPGPDTVTPTTDLSKGACLNRVLRKIYPRGTMPKVTDLVAFLDDDQVVHPTFLSWCLPAIEGQQVRLVHTRPAYENVSLHGDVFSQINHVEYESRIPGYEALGFCSPSSTAYVVRADALQRCNWLPMHSRASHLALGQELKLQQFICHYINLPLAVGIAPNSIAQVYASKSREAEGQFQLYYHTRPAYALGHLSLLQLLLYGAHAWSKQVVALMVPIWIAVPIIQVIFDVFPFNPNRWFGLGFLLYWCIGTPLLFKSYRCGHARGFWHHTVTQHNLWATYFLCLVRTWVRKLTSRKESPAVQDLPPNIRKIKGEDVALSPTHKLGLAPAKFTDTEKGDQIPAGNASPFSNDPDQLEGGRTRAEGRHRRGSEVPWAALVGFVICAVFLAVGMWLLFGTNGSNSGARSAVSLGVLAANMPLVVSLLWLLFHTVMFTIPLLWALVCAASGSPSGTAGGRLVRTPRVILPAAPLGTPRTADTAVETTEKGSFGCLGVYSYVAWVICWAAVLLVAIACLGIGGGSIGSSGAYRASSSTDYSSLLSKNLAFYQAQQSGALSANPIAWRANSGLSDLPLGGWYEGGSNLKLTFPIAIAATQIAWAMVAVPGAFASSPSTAAHLASLQWGTDYLMACRPTQFDFVAQVGDYASETQTWDRPENMTTIRSNITVSTANGTAAGADLVSNAAAALAAASLVWETSNSAYAAQALIAAKDLYSFAQAVPGVYTQQYNDAALSYPSTSYLDDMAYAAAWMYYATKESVYLGEAEQYYNSYLQATSEVPLVNNWDTQIYASSLLLWQLTGNKTYRSDLEHFLSSWYNGDNGVSYLSSGVAYSSANGGALRNNANAAFLALLYRLEDHGSSSRKYACWARQQLELLTGSGTSQGYVVGFGNNPPLLASHRGASCAASVANCAGSTTDSAAYLSASANPHVLNGALVAGPGSGTYTDVRTDADNSVSIEYNSAFMGAVAILASESGNVCWKREGIVGHAGHPIGDE